MHNKLLTNSERVRRHMATNDQCELCGNGQEDLDHILRHCKLAASCWNLIIPNNLRTEFYSSTLQNCLMKNLGYWKSNPAWCITFGILCWNLEVVECSQRSTLSSETVQAHRLVNDTLSLMDHIIRARETYTQIQVG